MLTRLSVQGVRNLGKIDLPLTRCNLFFGPNGSGKTSLLESIYILFRGKSFRHIDARRFIHFEHERCFVYARTSDSQDLAILKTRQKTKLKLSGRSNLNQSELTRLMPVTLVDPSELELLDHGTGSRRQLLDWLCFHTESQFHAVWLKHARVLKQRNRQLKSLKTAGRVTTHQREELMIWSDQLAVLGEELNQIRMQVIERWQPLFEDKIRTFLPQYPGVRLSLRSGFDQDVALHEQLEERLTRDLEQGTTRLGAHRADLRVTAAQTRFDGTLNPPASDVLSRGEKKLLIIALKLSQIELLSARGRPCVVLLDDMTAELDQAATQRLLRLLKASEAQLFLTSLDQSISDFARSIWGADLSVFQIESGDILPKSA